MSKNEIKKAPVDRWVIEPIKDFINNSTTSGIVLFSSAVIAMILANSPLRDAYHHFWETSFSIGFGEHVLTKSLHHWINDGLMAVFFFVVGLELKREIVGGELSDPKNALLPIVAAAGGMIFPALIFLFFNSSGEASQGWGIPMATDIAFALGVLFLLGDRVPIQVKIFLTVLAIADDLGAVLIIAFFYTSQIDFDSLLEKEEKNDNTTTNNKITYENAGTKVIASGLITVLNGQLGNNNNDKKYGFSTDAWCEQFATWSLKQVTVSGQTLYQYLNTYGPIDDNMASGMWPVFKSGKSSNVTFEYSKAYGGNYTPKAGDIIWYQWKGSSCRGSNGKWDKVTKCVDHVGIVTSSDSNYVYTIEGNTGDPGLVRKRERDITSDEIIAYGSWYK